MEKLLQLFEEFELKLNIYEKDASGANREALYQAFLRAKEQKDTLPDDVKVKIIEAWQIVEIYVNNFRMMSNGWNTFASFGMNKTGVNTQINAMKPYILMVKKNLREMIQPVVEEAKLNEQIKAQLSEFLNILIILKDSVENYVKAHSGTNREAVQKAYQNTKSKFEALPENYQIELNDKWFVISTSLPSFFQQSNGFMKFATFGTSTMSSNILINNVNTNLLIMISKIQTYLK